MFWNFWLEELLVLSKSLFEWGKILIKENREDPKDQKSQLSSSRQLVPVETLERSHKGAIRVSFPVCLLIFKSSDVFLADRHMRKQL